MNRVLTTVLAVALLLGLGALAVLALPGASAPLAAAPFVSAAAPDAPMAARNFNMIAMPLDATDQFVSAGYTFTADGLMQLAGGGTKVKQVGHWLADQEPAGMYETWTWDPIGEEGIGTDFNLEVGQAYWLLLESTASDVISFVGDVPEPESVSFALVRGTPCRFNQLSIPLDQAAVADADDLMTALGAKQISQWVASGTNGQSFESWTWDPIEEKGIGTNFEVSIGYPYVVCLQTGTPTVWP